MKSVRSKSYIDLRASIPSPRRDPAGARATFAVLALGVIDAIELGLLDTESAVRFFFHADNAMFVRRDLKDKLADDVMARGLQLSDLFTVLDPVLANRAFRVEIEKMRSACRTLIGRAKLAA